MKVTIKHIKKLLPMFAHLIHYRNLIKDFVKKDKKYSYSFRHLFYRNQLNYLNKHYFKLVFISEGLEKSKDMQVLFAPNHQAYTDSVTMLTLCDRAIGFVTKKETKSLPVLIKNGMDSIGSVSIDRSDLRSEVTSFKKINDLLSSNKDLSYVIYPEGTRSLPPDFKMGLLHPGSFKIATRLGIPIVPVCLFGDEKLLNPKFHLRKYPVQVRFLDPIYPEIYDSISPNDLAIKIKDEMEKNLEEMRELDFKYVQVLNNLSDKKIEKLKNMSLQSNIRY